MEIFNGNGLQMEIFPSYLAPFLAYIGSWQDGNHFVINMVKSKLSYWSYTQLSLVGRTLIVNEMLMFSLWHFIAIWVGSEKVLGNINALLRNYLCFNSENTTISCASWDDCMFA